MNIKFLDFTGLDQAQRRALRSKRLHSHWARFCRLIAAHWDRDLANGFNSLEAKSFLPLKNQVSSARSHAPAR